MRWALALAVTACGLSLVQNASGRSERYCTKPDNAGAFLAASAGVTCATATKVVQYVDAACGRRTTCAADGFRCVAYWNGRFDRPFDYTHHGLCSRGWQWIVWDGG